MRAEFQKDIFDLLHHKQGGHVQKWLYADIHRPKTPTGHTLWHNFLAVNQNYYPLRAEISLIPGVVKALRKSTAVFADTLVDFGVGDEQAIVHKSLNIARGLPFLNRYTGVDLIADQLSTAKHIINRRRPDLLYTSKIADFYDSHINLEGTNKLGMLVGLTISNQPMMEHQGFPRLHIVNRLRNLLNILKGSGQNHLLISYDSNDNLDAAWRAYNHEIWRRMMRGLMIDLQTQLKPQGNFNPALWRYAHSIDSDKHVISHVLTATENQAFLIGTQSFDIKKGERFVVKNNFKYPTPVFQELCHEAGFKINAPPIGSKDHSVKFQILDI